MLVSFSRFFLLCRLLIQIDVLLVELSISGTGKLREEECRVHGSAIVIMKPAAFPPKFGHLLVRCFS